MARTAVSHATPALIAWARKTAGYDLEETASWMGVDSALIGRWEAGEESPSIAQLKRLGERYKRPLAVFFLPEPPPDFTVPKDFRSFPGHEPAISPQVRWELRRAEAHREAALELLDDLGQQAPPFRRLSAVPDSPEEFARRMRKQVGVTTSNQRSWKGKYDALKGWREAVEQSGVMVLQVSRIDEDEHLSGACIHHEVLPIILVNGATPVRRRIFTILHEYAHLMMGSGGVCDTHDGEISDTEVYCNAVAAATLMPKQEFLAHEIVKAHSSNSIDWSDDDLARLSKDFTSSKEAVLRRALTFGKTTPGHYRACRAHMLVMYEAEKERERRRNASREPSGRRQGPLIINRNGYTFTRWAFEAYDRNLITMNELSGYFDAKVKWVPDVRHLAGA